MQGLLPNYKYRLGLSATPSKYMDEEATDYLLDYFGGIIFTFGLKEALLMRNPDTNQTYLTPYMYYPKKVGLTREEIEEYKFQNKKLVVAMNSKNSSDKEDTNIKAGNYIYDIQVSLQDGRVDTIVLPSKFEVLEGVTNE